MNWIVTLYSALLFFLLTPAILVRIPPKGGKYTVALVHALVFALIWHFTHKFIWKLSVTGFTQGMAVMSPAAAVIAPKAAHVANVDSK
jgi:hypothetical protein